MNRRNYFNYIQDKLVNHQKQVEQRGRLNLLDDHLHSENFYMYLLNKLYGYELTNLNDSVRNVEAIDLIDEDSKIIIQVSSKNDKTKIQEALNKQSLSNYQGFTFKYVCIGKDATKLRGKEYKIPDYLNFNPDNDIYDVEKILKDVYDNDITIIEDIYRLIKSELGSNMDPRMIVTNLAEIINVIASNNLNGFETLEYSSTYEIERKIDFNQLHSARQTIDEYKVYHYKLDEIYTTFDDTGYNRSKSVLDKIKREYLKRQHEEKTADGIFYTVCEKLVDIVLNSANYTGIALDLVELCVDVLVVDAFIRCKIFANPEDYYYASS